MSKKKCPICGAEMKIDTSVVCTSIPPKYRCVCPSCYYLGFINTSEYDQYKEEPSLPSDLDEAAEEYNKQVIEETKCHHNALTYAEGYEDALLLIPDAFIAGAQWQAEQNDKDLSEKIAAAYQLGLANKEEQMMKDAVEADVNTYEDIVARQSWAEFVVKMSTNKLGDKVRIIIVKEDER